MLANNQLVGYGYDAAGNMTHDSTTNVNYTFDAENRITGAAGYTYTYDADGNRVEKSNGSAGTIYWYMSPGIVAESDLSGNLKSEYVFFDGERVARKDFPGNAVSYYFSDHLKTASVITNSAGVITEDEDYYPWGGELQFVNSDSNHYKFTGKERDSETGLDYFGARYYGNWYGRFLSADWSAKPEAVPYSDLHDPQSLNLYSYVRNVPTSKADVDGHDDWITATVNFTVGLLNAWGSDNLAGAGRMEQTTVAGKVGQAIGDLGATIQGGVETLAGGAGEVGGTVLDATGAGAVVGVPLNVVSAGAIVHGSVTTATAGTNFLKDVTGSSSGSGKPYEATEQNLQEMEKGNAPLDKDGNRVELHHDGQQQNSPLKEMTQEQHRGGANFKANHPNTGQKPSNINRAKFKKQKQQHWQDAAKKHREQQGQ